MLAPFMRDGTPVSVAAATSYSISGPGANEVSRPRFSINTTARSGEGAKLVADVVQSEYEKMHKSKKSLQVESVRNLLENLLAQSLDKESALAVEMSEYKKRYGLPFLDDAKRNSAERKSQYSSEVTNSKLEQIRIDSLLRQVLAIQARIGSRENSSKSEDIDNDIALIKDFFEMTLLKTLEAYQTCDQLFLI